MVSADAKVPSLCVFQGVVVEGVCDTPPSHFGKRQVPEQAQGTGSERRAWFTPHEVIVGTSSGIPARLGAAGCQINHQPNKSLTGVLVFSVCTYTDTRTRTHIHSV